MSDLPSIPPRLSRRTAIAAAGAAAIGAVGTWLLARDELDDDSITASIRVAGGEPGGLYNALAALLSSELIPEVADQAIPLTTAGSIDNLEQLQAGTADIGLAVANSLLTAPDLPAVGRVYQNYLHCIVRDDSPFHVPADLTGARVGVGPTGSGTNPLSRRSLDALGLSSDTTEMLSLSLHDAAAAFAAGDLDALMFSSGLPVPAITVLAAQVPIRLLDLTAAIPALNAEFADCFRKTYINATVYGLDDNVPAIAVANLLIAGPHVPDDVISAVADVLVERADMLVRDSVGIQFLTLESLIDTYPARLHPAAARSYRKHYG